MAKFVFDFVLSKEIFQCYANICTLKYEAKGEHKIIHLFTNTKIFKFYSKILLIVPNKL